MKLIRWLLSLAAKNPLLFGIALLLIAVMVLAGVVKNRDNKIDIANEENRQLRIECSRRTDSIAFAYSLKETELNRKVEDILNSIIADYKQQLEDQRNLSRKVNTTINNNRRIIKQTKNN